MNRRRCRGSQTRAPDLGSVSRTGFMVPMRAQFWKWTLSMLMAGFLTCGAADAPPPSEVNYVLHVDWKSNQGETNSLQFVTIEGTFKWQSYLPSDSEYPSTVSVEGDLQALDLQQGRLRLFLGRTVPSRVTRGSSAVSVQQLQVGLNSTFLVTFGKPVLVQKDAHGEVTVRVERAKP